jgi:hypothetical protein
MNNLITSFLENIEKPNKDFIQDKECLICLESIDIELNKIVKLPCSCANSVYHIICIESLLKSGENKNFCPHCKTIYTLPIQEQNIVVPLQNYIVINRENDEYKLIEFSKIILFHVVSNSIMNIINLLIVRDYSKYNVKEELQVLALFYLCKILLNFCIFLFSKNNMEIIENCLICSYTYQVILFGFLIYSSNKIISNSNIIIIIINNIFFGFIDIFFRIITEYKMRNRITPT